MRASILYLEFIPFVKAFLLMNVPVYCPLFNRLTYKTIFLKTKSCMIMSFHGLFSWAVRGVTLFGCILKNFLCMNRVCSSKIIQSIKIPIWYILWFLFDRPCWMILCTSDWDRRGPRERCMMTLSTSSWKPWERGS